MTSDRAILNSESGEARPKTGLPSYHGFANRPVESALYGVLQRRFLSKPKECDVRLGEILEDLLPGETNLKVLDVGCGNGQAVLHLEGLFTSWKYVGIDLREVAIREANRASAVSYFQEADLFGYDPGELLDVIVCQNVTYSFTDEQFQDALSRLRSWLPPGGIVILFDMFTPWEQHLTIIERSRLHPDGHPLTVRPYSQLREVASTAGFGVLEIRPFSYSGGEHWADPHDLRSYDHGGLTMRGCFNQPQAHAVLVAV